MNNKRNIMNIPNIAKTKSIISLYFSCMLAMYFIEYVILDNNISLGFVVFSAFVSLYFVITLTLRDKLLAFLKRTLLNIYIDVIIRLIIMALHFYITSRLFDVIVFAHSDLTFNSIYLLLINLPIFSLVISGYNSRA
jgi:hypothetical protein